jgi:hypothetical protein
MCRAAAALCFLVLVLPGFLHGQVGSTTDILTGTVTDENGAPLAGAIVEALSLETQITRRTNTDARGRYTILFPDGGGQYQMTARYLGRQPQQTTLQRYADEDRFTWSPQLPPVAITLAPVTVHPPPRAVRAPDVPTPGSTERAFSPELVGRLPLEDNDLNLLATLVPGVVGLAATDSTAAAFSVAGLRSDANAVTLDGLNISTSSLPQEGLRATRIVTSTYDVSRGAFSGGLVAATTRGGANIVQGASSYALRDQSLAVADDESSPFTSGYTQNQLSGGIGGPLARDRLFIFASGQVRLRDDAQMSLLDATPTDLERLGVRPDSVTRFLGALQAIGLSPTSVQPTDTRTTDNLTSLLRLDYIASNAHTITLRADGRWGSQDPSRIQPLSLPQVGGSTSNWGAGLMVSVTSRFGMHVINEAKIYPTVNRQDGEPFTALPSGRVLLASDLSGTAAPGIGVGTLVFGGNASLPTGSRSSGLEASDEISFLPGSGSHRLKLGVTAQTTQSTTQPAANRLGTFTYNSLADLESNQPASFSRTLVVAARAASSQDYAVYAADVWRASPALQLTYGLRVEGSRLGNPPPLNTDILAQFGHNTSQLPHEWHLSPRAGFTWTIGAMAADTSMGGRGAGAAGGGSRSGSRGPFGGPALGGQPALIIRGGAGEFRSPIPGGLVASAQSATGLAGSATELICIGNGVPVPDWSAYAADTVAIPDSCASGGPPVAPETRPVVLFGPNYEAPRAWRATLGAQRNLTRLLHVSVDAGYTRGVHQYGFRDLNLVATPSFFLGNERNRPVYVSPADIVAATGAVSLAASRRDTTYGQVLEIGSDLGSEAKQLTISLGGLTRRGVVLQASYTWSQSRDQLSASRFGASGFAAATTAGDPNVREWAPSDFDRRHAFLGVVTYPLGASLEITTIGRLTSGSPFTPLVGGDINGDGARNDRAFIFDPAGGASESAAMSRLLATADPRIADCLRQQIGTVAARNTCRGPWQASLDLQLNYRPQILGLQRRLTMSVSTINLLRGIDELLHGVSGAHGWGLTLQPDPTLLYVTGFDSTTRQFIYAVNERFGATGQGANAYRAPFQIGIQVHVTIGPDRQQAALDALRGFGGGMGRGGAGGFGGAGRLGPAARLDSVLPNPPAQVLALRDSLSLTHEQVTALEAARDSLAGELSVVADSMRGAAAALDPSGDRSAVVARVRAQFALARDAVTRALDAVRSVLTPQQWSRVPESIRNPQ